MQVTKSCPECGVNTDVSAPFCKQCGQQLVNASSTSANSVDTRRWWRKKRVLILLIGVVLIYVLGQVGFECTIYTWSDETFGSLTANPEDYVVPVGVTLMSEQEIRANIIGNSVTGYWQGEEFYEYLAPDGTIRGLSAGRPYDGIWSISGTVLCWDYPSDGDGCWTVSINGDQLTYYTKNGEISGGVETLLSGDATSSFY